MRDNRNPRRRSLSSVCFLLVLFACCVLAGNAEARGGAGLQSSDTFEVGERISTFPRDLSVFSCNIRNASVRYSGGTLTATIGGTGRIECSDYAYTCDTGSCEIVDQVVTAGIVRREPTGGGTNSPPRATGSIPAQTMTVGGGAASVDVARYFTDPDGDRLTYTARSSRAGVVRASVSGSTVTLAPVTAGTATVTVTARDPDGASATQTIAVTVEEDGGTNQPPRAIGSIPAQTLTVGGRAASVNVARYFTDPDGDRLTYTARSSRTSIVRVSVSGSTATLAPVAAGTATVTVTARDPGGLSATQSIAVTVAASGVSAFTDDPLVPEVTPVRAVHFQELRTRIDALRVRAGLPAFAWTDRVLTPGVTPVGRVHVTELRTALRAAYAAAGRPVPRYTDARVTPGTTPIRASHITELRAAVVELEALRANRPPQASGSIPAQTLAADAGRVDVAPYFNDPDGDPLTFAAASSRVDVVTVGVAGSIVTLTPVDNGTATVTVTARDAAGLSATQRIAVTVQQRSGGSCTNDLGTVSGTVTRRGSWDGSCPGVHYSGTYYARYYSFTLNQSASITIDLASSTVDTWLALLSGSGTGVDLIESDNNSGTGTER